MSGGRGSPEWITIRESEGRVGCQCVEVRGSDSDVWVRDQELKIGQAIQRVRNFGISDCETRRGTYRVTSL